MGAMSPEGLRQRDGASDHVYLRSFADRDGLGELPGLISRADYLNGAADSLGIEAIGLSPCFPSPDKDFDYDVAAVSAASSSSFPTSPIHSSITCPFPSSRRKWGIAVLPN